MYEFSYRLSSSVDDATLLFAEAADPQYVAGGMTMLPTMKQRLASPDVLIDLNGIASLKGIEKLGDEIVIGALATHAQVAVSDIVQQNIPALAELASVIGDPQVRNRGTLGGSIANADPAADYPAAVLGLSATIHTNKRTILADEFFVDIFETALEEGELITQVSFPVPEKAAYQKFSNQASGYAIVGVFVSLLGGAIRVAVTGAAGSVFRASAMESALDSDFAASSLAGVKIDSDEFNEDIHASADYRAHLIGVMAKRAVESLT